MAKVTYNVAKSITKHFRTIPASNIGDSHYKN